MIAVLAHAQTSLPHVVVAYATRRLAFTSAGFSHIKHDAIRECEP